MRGDESRELVDLVPTPLVAPYLRPELEGRDRRDIEFPGVPFRVFDEGGDEGKREVAVFHDHEVVAVPDVLGDHVQIVIVFIDVSVEAFFASAAGFCVGHGGPLSLLKNIIGGGGMAMGEGVINFHSLECIMCYGFRIF